MTDSFPKAGRRVFSAIQPSGSLHLGHYLGVMRHFADLQEDFGYECFYAVADLHSFTELRPPGELAHRSREVVAGLLAAGVNPEKSVLFVQSHVPCHTELAWILSCIARIGWLGRMTQFKDKSGQDREHVSAGLFLYPVLMAADILAYRATHVPVGEDQMQHLELVREIAGKFNRDFCSVSEVSSVSRVFFPDVQGITSGHVSRTMSLRDGMCKMSSSDPSDRSRINLTDDTDTIVMKVRKAKTDSSPVPCTSGELAMRPEARNLITIYAALTGQTTEQILKTYGGLPFSRFKADLTEVLVSVLVPLGVRMRGFLDASPEMDQILEKGREKAYEVSSAVLEEVRRLAGFLCHSSRIPVRRKAE